MASAVWSRASSIVSSSSVISSATVRRRFPLVGAFCVLTFGLSNLSYSLLKTGCAQSLPFAPLLRSKFGGRSAGSRTFRSARMEAGGNTVPSIVVYVTVPNKEAGKKLAESIVREKLAACVNRVPGIESVYQWEGEVQTDSEELLIIKTRQSLLEALTEHVKANHEYDVPEVIALPILGGSVQYLEWIKNSTRD
ncbi:protein CutA, chloroplastic [Punica granatum]|uniref:Protein CutA, chloroplastic n=2 Tax=Punica granatum TaxID=22663 RepID=A0A6P8DZL7_PUNGR|nr:protein CutA, chloroplastic [Punica granatum]